MRVEIRSDHDPEVLFGTVPVDAYGVKGTAIEFEIPSGKAEWVEGDKPEPDVIELTWGNFTPDGVSMYPAIMARTNQIEELRRIPGFVEGKGTP